MKSTTNQLYAICVLLFALFICAQVQIDTLKRKFDNAMFNLAEFEHNTILNEGNFDDTFNDLYLTLDKHQTQINILAGEPALKFPNANEIDEPTDAVLEYMEQEYRMDSLYRAAWRKRNLAYADME